MVTTYVALLYSIVLPDGKRLVMSDLKDMAKDLGLIEPRTILATGNLVFESKATSVPKLEEKLEAAFAGKFGKSIPMIVRTAEDWLKLVRNNPFPEESERDGSLVAVRVQRNPLPASLMAELEPLRMRNERLALVNGDIWFVSPNQLSGSRLYSALTPRKLGVGTFRNWNTTRKLGEMLVD